MLAEKMLQLKLPAAHSVRIQGAMRRALHRSVLLGRAAIFGHEEDNGLQDSPRAGCHFGREEMDVRSRRVSSTHAWMGR